MYYGRGAGKLPTASAVVSDVVDCARHMGKTIMCFWDAEDVKLTSIDEVERRFFVRADLKSEAEVIAAFGKVEKIQVESLPDEFGFVTQVMTEKQFSEKAKAAAGIRSRIRIEE